MIERVSKIMRDEQKTKAELLQELDTLRCSVAQLEQAERKKIAEKLEEPEQTFRTIFDNAADGIVLADVENKKFYIANKMFCQLLGYNSQEIKNLGVLSIHPEEDLPYVLEQFEKQARREFTFAKNIPVRRKDGRVFYADINSFLIKLAGKTYMVGIFRDITEHRKVKEKIERLAMFPSENPYPVLRISRDGTILYHNKAAELLLEIWKYREGKPLSGRWHECVLNALDSGVISCEMCYEIKHKDQIFSLTFAPVVDSHYVNVYGLDITERKKTENKLRESETQVRSLIQTAPNIILHLSPDHRILEFNPEAEQFFGRKRDDVLGQNYLELFVPEQHRDGVAADIEKVLAGELTRNYENLLIAHDGSKHLFMWNVNRMLDKEDKPSGIIAIGQDITERKNMENRQALRFEISKTFHQQEPLKKICQKIVSLIQEYLDYEVVALRMKEGDDYPYFVNNGFSQKFIKTENYLCIHDEKGDCLRDSRGHLVLACMCGIVINAKFNQDKPFFTKEGSFWTNSTSDLLASTTAEDRGETTRNVCNQYGYESIALIPIKVKDDNIGLLQINDKRRNLFSLGSIQFLEELGRIIGIATEHIKAEEALRESEESLAIAQRVACIGSWDWNIQDNTLTWSDETYRQFGFKPNEITPTYEAFVDFVHRDDRERVNQAVKQAIDEQKPYSIDVRMIRVDGTEWIMHSQGTVQRNKNGKTVRFVGTQQDITVRKKAEEEIEKFKKMADLATHGCAMAEPDGNLVYVNDSFAKMHGYVSAELIGKNLEIFHTDAQMKRVGEINKRLIETGQGIQGQEVWHVRQNGTEFPSLMSNWVLRDDNGKPLLICATVIDITERKKVEDALRESEERLRVALSAAQMGTWRWDPVTNQDTRDASLNQILGLEAIESIQPVEDFLHFVHPDDRDMVDEEIQRAIRERRTYVAEFRIIRSDGTVRWLRDQGKLLCDENDRVLCLTGAVIDITELKQAQEKISKYREKMVQAEELAAVGTLSATLAHELTQPLTVLSLSIGNSLAELEKMSCPDTVVEDLKEGLSEISSMTSMINRFRNFAKMSLKRTVGEIDFKAIAGEIVKLLDESAWRAKVTLQVEGMDKLPLIYSYERDLEQLFFSLIENAIQAADGKKKHRVIISGAVRDDEHIELQFSDNCGGIAPENLDRIFEPFFTTKHADERTGLGLCVVERIVSQSGGEVRVESEFGKGSTFFVTLPIKRDER